MGREIYDIINDMAEVLNASQMQKLQEVLVKRLSENTVSDYLQTTNVEFLDMFLTAKHLEGCSDKTIRYYRCNIEKMLDTVNIPVIENIYHKGACNDNVFTHSERSVMM